MGFYFGGRENFSPDAYSLFRSHLFCPIYAYSTKLFTKSRKNLFYNHPRFDFSENSINPLEILLAISAIFPKA